MLHIPAIIAVDLDGTVLGVDHKTIPPRTAACLDRYIAQGAMLIPVTGRTPAMIPAGAFPPFRYLISSNGGYIFDLKERKLLRSSYIPREFVKTCWQIVKERVHRLGIVMELYVDDQIVVEQKVYDHFPAYAENLPAFHQIYISSGRAEYTPAFDEYLEKYGDNVVKINFPGQSIRHCPEIREELAATDLFEVTSDGLNLELNRKGCHKGEALQWLSSHLGIPMDSVAAFGNGDNDISMLRVAGFGVAMGNADASVKTAAKYTTLSNTDDGIAHFLEHQFPITYGD